MSMLSLVPFLIKSTKAIESIIHEFIILPAEYVEQIPIKTEQLQNRLSTQFKEIMDYFYTLDFNETYKNLEVGNKDLQEEISKESNAKQNYLIKKCKTKQNSILIQFIIIMFIFAGFGAYNMINLTNYYDKLFYSMHILQNSAERLPYLTLMVLALKQETELPGELVDLNGINLFNKYLDMYKKNEAEFNKNFDSLQSYYTQGLAYHKAVTGSEMCEIFYSSEDDKTLLDGNIFIRMQQWTL